jgi:hyperosmotically inducible periplasmic protein
MKTRMILIAAMSAVTLLATTGCAVTRGQESVGAYIDDATLTTRVKAKFAEDPVVSTMAISVETMKGVVQLGGFAKTSQERSTAERLARATSGVVQVRNDIVVRS